MITLSQLTEAGARAAYESQNGPWEFLSEEGAAAVLYEFSKGLAAILPLLADDLAGVAENHSFSVEIGEWMDMTKKDISAHACNSVAQAIRTRVATLMEGE